MKDGDFPAQLPLRPPGEVMRLARLGAMFPTRLSFLRSLVRDLSSADTPIARRLWQIDAKGFGHALYTVQLRGHVYTLVAVSTDLPDDQRTDRVIATAWDMSFVLYDGIPDKDALERICASAPKQEAARFTERELVLSRANKSVRLFKHVVSRLRAGRQPDKKMVRDIGYLVRTTAVYGNGKFGIADRDVFADRPGMGGPFRAEMLAVYLIRLFSIDLVEHLGAAPLAPAIRRHFGVGNSTGLGMAPFLVNHPVLLNNWMMVRETALARVCAQPALASDAKDRLVELYKRAGRHLTEWQVPDPVHLSRIKKLRAEWCDVAPLLSRAAISQRQPLAAVMAAVAKASVDVQELMVALLLEPFGDLVDGLSDCMGDATGPVPCQFATTAEVRRALEVHFGWATAVDYAQAHACRHFWYVSACKQEPRLGDRFAEAGAALESPLDIGRRLKQLAKDLPADDTRVSDFATAHPEHGLALARVALAGTYPYAEIRDNLIGQSCLPIDMLRCKLAFFGASKFDPKSDRWTRITLCQGAPLPSDLGTAADDWWLPVYGE
ncbi:MAG: hypothetical protein AAF636_01525 [Pseudomonadota bacterium]